MSEDDVGMIAVLAVLLTMILGPAALLIWLLLRALRRSRAADREHCAPHGFDVIKTKRK
jgi:hypothetical protein